jgi:hypothetical protein
MPTTLELTLSASLIFSGTVVERGTQRCPRIPPCQKLVVVRVRPAAARRSRAWRFACQIDHSSAIEPEKLSPDQRAVS